MGAMASQITNSHDGLLNRFFPSQIKKRQSSASLAFVTGEFPARETNDIRWVEIHNKFQELYFRNLFRLTMVQ